MILSGILHHQSVVMQDVYPEAQLFSYTVISNSTFALFKDVTEIYLPPSFSQIKFSHHMFLSTKYLFSSFKIM